MFIDRIVNDFEKGVKAFKKRPYEYDINAYQLALKKLNNDAYIDSFHFKYETSIYKHILKTVKPFQFVTFFKEMYYDCYKEDGPEHIETYLVIITKEKSRNEDGTNKEHFFLNFYEAFESRRSYQPYKKTSTVKLPPIESSEKIPTAKNLNKRLAKIKKSYEYDKYDNKDDNTYNDSETQELLYQIYRFAKDQCKSTRFIYSFIKYMEQRMELIKSYNL